MLCGISCKLAGCVHRPIMDFPSPRWPAEAKPNLSQLYLSRLSFAKPAKLNFFKTPASVFYVSPAERLATHKANIWGGWKPFTSSISVQKLAVERGGRGWKPPPPPPAYFLVHFILFLKVPKCEIFDRWDSHDFYTIKPFCVGDFGAKNVNLLL
jgi:hypothetical protein